MLSNDKKFRHKKRFFLFMILFALAAWWIIPIKGGLSAGDAMFPSSNPEETPETPSESAMPSVTGLPTATPAPTEPPVKYSLLNKDARYKKGAQTGIHYKKVKGKKLYHLKSYTTDTVTLHMSHPSSFRVYGGKSKKEVKKKYVAVSSKGVVRSRRKKKGDKIYTIVEAVSKLTGEKQYIYIYFQERLYVKTGKSISLYERYAAQLRFNYGRKKLSFSSTNPKKASVNAKGKVTGKKHGTAYINVKVKGSQKNQIKIRVRVKVEPWIVSAKNKVYDYEDMVRDLHKLREKYPYKTRLFSLGKTVDKRDVWCIRLGKDGAQKKLIINAAIHAREWKNVQVIMRQTEDMLREYRDYKERFQKTCIYIVPMDNPDGVSISQYGFDAVRNKKLRKLCKRIGHARRWKANARGVDLNDNFPAGFQKDGRRKKPDYMAYPGKKAASERETKMLMRLVHDVQPQAVLNVHSTGSVIYWDFDVDEKLHDKLYQFAVKVNSFNDYILMPPNGSTRATGGFADWLNYEKGIPSITIETGTSECPLPHSEYASIYKRNNKMFRWFMTKY